MVSQKLKAKNVVAGLTSIFVIYDFAPLISPPNFDNWRQSFITLIQYYS